MNEKAEVHTPAPSRPSAAATPYHGSGADNFSVDTISRATLPGIPASVSLDDDGKKRYRPRTFSYFSQLPYPAEDKAERDATLTQILEKLYIAIKAEDFMPGALHLTRELKEWLKLKFEMTRKQRARLARLYYHLALAPGLETTAANCFSSMLITLTRKMHYLRPGEDLVLDWRPLWKELKNITLSTETAVYQSVQRVNRQVVLRICLHVQSYLDPSDRREMLDEILPYFNANSPNAFVVIRLLAVMVPTMPAPPTASQPSDFVPTYFHLWSLLNRSKATDVSFIDIFSRMSRDYLACQHVPFTAHGIFTEEQSVLIFTALLRLTEIPVGQAGSPYVSTLDKMGSAEFLHKGWEEFPISKMAARWIVYSLSPQCLDTQGNTNSTPASTILTGLEAFLESIDTFFHPSREGTWTIFLAQFTHYLSGIFVKRWNREQSGELDLPADRRITPGLKRRFVLALRDAMFVGLFTKSQKVSSYYYITLRDLAFLEPGIILPGALQRFYPGLQGLVEVHRTTASLCGLQRIAPIMSRQRGFRCHITTLSALALPGIDANDLDKTQHTLEFIQSVAYNVPFATNKDNHDGVHGAGLAMEWVRGEIERFESGQDIQIDYNAELTDEEEARILHSSTADFDEFIRTLLSKVFTLVENLPDSSHVHPGSPEDKVINLLPAALTPFFAALSPELFDMALDKLASFVASHVVYQARDVMASICNALCKVSPEKTLKIFIPLLTVNIRNEIDYNGAAAERSSGADVLPRDQALVWHVNILSMCVVHIGGEVLKYKNELLDIVQYMQDNCSGLPTIYVSEFVHHLLLNLTNTYTIDNAMFEPGVVNGGIDLWGQTTAPSDLTIKWYRPSQLGIRFAAKLFESQVNSVKQKMEALMSADPPVSRKGKSWSDEVSRTLSRIRLVMSGASALFDPARVPTEPSSDTNDPAVAMDISSNPKGGTLTPSVAVSVEGGDKKPMEEDVATAAEVASDDEQKREFSCRYGYPLDRSSMQYKNVHELRKAIGRLLIDAHVFLNSYQEDDVTCLTALYTTYRTFITDVGFARSTPTLKRQLRLYWPAVEPLRLKGLRKVYPRALLVKRADAYQLRRVKYSTAYRLTSQLDKQLLTNLAQSCTSPYVDVRKAAQTAQETSLKMLIGSRPVVIPTVLRNLEESLDRGDHNRVKGAMYTLLFTSLFEATIHDWRFAPTLMKLYVRTADVDKESIKTLGARAGGPLCHFGKAFEPMVVVDNAVLASIAPTKKDDRDDTARKILKRHSFILEHRKRVEEKKAALGLELVRLAASSNWRVADRGAYFASNLCLRFGMLVPGNLIQLVAEGTINQDPKLRVVYQNVFNIIFMFIELRARYGNEYRNYLLLENERTDNRLEIQVPVSDGHEMWTSQYLKSFEIPGSGTNGNSADHAPLSNSAKTDSDAYFVDSKYPGWLVWGKSFSAYRKSPIVAGRYDTVGKEARQQIGKILTKDWLKQYFDFMKQEPYTDGFREGYVTMLRRVFELMHSGVADLTFDDVETLTLAVYDDGSNRHQHRATSEIVAAFLSAGPNEPKEYRDRAWAFAGPLLLDAINNKLTPENLNYWEMCVNVVTNLRDPQRYHELVVALGSFRLETGSNAAFKESSKLRLLETLIIGAGWHFREERPIVSDILAHIDHPYESVRQSIGLILDTIYRLRYHESFKDVATLLEMNKAVSSVGIRPYKATSEFSKTVAEVFQRLETWRQQKQSSYTFGSNTVLTWLYGTLSSYACTQLVQFFPEPFIDQLLHMMDVKEDPELMSGACHVYHQLPNIPLREGEDEVFIRKLIDVGRSASSWHQRLLALDNLQVVYFRRLFLTRPTQRKLIFDAVVHMLADAQLEVRDLASTTLAGMIQCSPASIQNTVISPLKQKFEEQLQRNPMSKRKRSIPAGAANALAASAGGRETPIDLVIRRHAAVLGLGALVEAFTYATPPPSWMPEVLSYLATRTAHDPGVVGKATKSILAEFKKTRQDTWTVDQTYFTAGQLENLEDVLCQSYIA